MLRIIIVEEDAYLRNELIHTFKMERYPNVVSKSDLFSAVWGTEEFVDENILQVNMSRLRKNLSEIGMKNAVQNIRGKGYVLEVGEL